MLVGVGGLLGIHRSVAVEALRAGLKAGALGAVLSPPDPKVDPAQLVASLAGLFRRRRGGTCSHRLRGSCGAPRC